MSVCLRWKDSLRKESRDRLVLLCLFSEMESLLSCSARVCCSLRAWGKLKAKSGWINCSLVCPALIDVQSASLILALRLWSPVQTTY